MTSATLTSTVTSKNPSEDGGQTHAVFTQMSKGLGYQWMDMVCLCFNFHQNWSKLVNITHKCLMQHFVKKCVEPKTGMVPLTSLTPNFYTDRSFRGRKRTFLALYCTHTSVNLKPSQRFWFVEGNRHISELQSIKSTNYSKEKITCLRIRR